VNRRRWVLALSVCALILGAAAACSPIYVIKAGIAEAKILRARRPLPEVILDPATDERTRGKLTYVMEARQFAIERLGLDVGDAYTSFTQLDSDTLALVLSAAYRDRLASKTWWFPVVGHVPYKGFFDLEDAQGEQEALERDGFDTYLRPTAAFSTLGWFADPLLSTLVRNDEVELVETVLHELSHNHLFVKGQVRFNESFATWVGRVAAIEFFCTREGSGPDSVKCLRAQARWRDFQRFSAFLDRLVEDLQSVYGDEALSSEAKVERREIVFDRFLTEFREEVQPSFEESTFGVFVDRPLNNATLLSRMRYYHRLADFQALVEEQGGLRPAVEYLAGGVAGAADPFDLLPTGGVAPPPVP
jgi:predicted aminopeptidase